MGKKMFYNSSQFRTIFLFFLITISSLVDAQDHQKSENSSIKADTIIEKIDSSKYLTQTLDLMVRQQMKHYYDSLEILRIQNEIENTNETQRKKSLEDELKIKKEADSISLANLKNQIQKSKNYVKGYPTIVAGDTVRIIYASMGSFTPEERAENCQERIENIAQQFIVDLDTLSLINNERNIEIHFMDKVITTISYIDAIWAEREQLQMAIDSKEKILGSIKSYQSQRSLMTMAKQVLLTLLVLVVCYILIKLVNRSFHYKIKKALLSHRQRWFKVWKIKDYDLFTPERQMSVVLSLIRIIRIAIIIIIIYIALSIIFSLFPITQRLADLLFSWITSPLVAIFSAIINFLPNMFRIIIICIVMKYVIQGVRFFMHEIETEKIKITGFYPDWAPATYNILKILLYAFSFVLIFNYLPYSDSKTFQGVSVFIGIVFSLGSSSAISNIVAGLVITYMRPYKIGDHIKIGEVTGDVIEKTPFVTRIKTHKREIVTIPNNNILTASVINYSTSAKESEGIIFHITITIGYDVPWRKIHEMMIEAARRSKYISEKPAPFVLQTSLDDFYVSYQLCAYSKYPEKQASIYSLLNQNIQDVFNENGVEIMSPHYRSKRDGSETTIPQNYRT